MNLITVQCANCRLTQQIRPIGAYLVDLAGWHLHWTCHGTHQTPCEAVNVQAVPLENLRGIRAAGAGALTNPALVHEHRQDLMPEFDEDEYLELARAIHDNQLGHFAAFVAHRLEPETVR